MDNVKVTAKNGGSIKNYEVEIRNSEFIFEENNMDFSVDEFVATVDSIIDAGLKDQLVSVIQALKGSNTPEKSAEIIKGSSLSKFFKTAKDSKPLVDMLISIGEKFT